MMDYVRIAPEISVAVLKNGAYELVKQLACAKWIYYKDTK